MKGKIAWLIASCLVVVLVLASCGPAAPEEKETVPQAPEETTAKQETQESPEGRVTPTPESTPAPEPTPIGIDEPVVVDNIELQVLAARTLDSLPEGDDERYPANPSDTFLQVLVAIEWEGSTKPNLWVWASNNLRLLHDDKEYDIKRMSHEPRIRTFSYIVPKVPELARYTLLLGDEISINVGLLPDFEHFELWGFAWKPALVTEEKVEWFDPIGPDTKKNWEIDNIISSGDRYIWEMGSGMYVTGPGMRDIQPGFNIPSDHYFICRPHGRPRLMTVSPTLTSMKHIDLTPYEQGEAFLDFDLAVRVSVPLYQSPLVVLISPDGGKTWDSDLEGTAYYDEHGDPERYKVDISDYLGSKIKIRFKARELRGWKSAIAIDNVYVRVFPEKRL